MDISKGLLPCILASHISHIEPELYEYVTSVGTRVYTHTAKCDQYLVRNREGTSTSCALTFDSSRAACFSGELCILDSRISLDQYPTVREPSFLACAELTVCLVLPAPPPPCGFLPRRFTGLVAAAKASPAVADMASGTTIVESELWGQPQEDWLASLRVKDASTASSS